MELNKIYNQDCIEGMRQYPDKFFQLAIVDPPYFQGPNLSGYYGKGYSNLGVKRAKYYKGCKEWNVPGPEYFQELRRVSKNQIIWGANHFAGVFDSSSPCWIIWDKDNGKSSFADAEIAYTSFRSAVRIFKYMWNGMHQGSFGGDVSKNEKRIHPTQKPVALYKWLLAHYANAGDKILDTHAGSCSSAIACIDMGFDYIAYELDHDYWKAGTERVRQFEAQLKLF
ncbi:DNA methyltransferase [Chitinophaga sp. MM2321]|uniref:DNA methyltransferase n=1 Tax=Chitinophaga sp. MM2321 TaxID=3137178 RepID=UPI0032D59E49